MTERDRSLLSAPAEHLARGRIEREISLVDQAKEHDAGNELRCGSDRDAPVAGEVSIRLLEDLLAVTVVDREPHAGDAGLLERGSRRRVDARELIVDGGRSVIVVAAADAKCHGNEDRRDPLPR